MSVSNSKPAVPAVKGKLPAKKNSIKTTTTAKPKAKKPPANLKKRVKPSSKEYAVTPPPPPKARDIFADPVATPLRSS